MASPEESDIVTVIRKTAFEGNPVFNACHNSQTVVMVTYDRRVYTCQVTDITTSQKYVKVIFPTSEEDNDPDINIVSVCCGRYHFLALSADGRVYSWGRNKYGQLGLPFKKQRYKRQGQPMLIKNLASYEVIQIVCGSDHSLALTRDGRLFSWGSNINGQLGVGDSIRNHTHAPLEVKDLQGVPLQQVAAGGAHTVVLSFAGSIFVWGKNKDGRLGLEQKEDARLPTKLITRKKVRGISCGENDIRLFEERDQAPILDSLRRQIPTLSAELLLTSGDVHGNITITEMKRNDVDGSITTNITKRKASLQDVRTVFSSPACINASFFQAGEEEDANNLSIDLETARAAFEVISTNYTLLHLISDEVSSNLCKNAPQSTPHEEALRFYLIVMECPIFSNPHHAWGRRVLAAVGRLMGFLCDASSAGGNNPNSATLAQFWKSERTSFHRTITAYRLALTFLVSNKITMEREHNNLTVYLKVLSSLHEVNRQHDILPIKTFYIPELRNFDLEEQVLDIIFNRHRYGINWLSYPFLVDLKTKIYLLAAHDVMKQKNAVEPERRIQQLIYGPLPPFLLPPISLDLVVSRDDVFGVNVRRQLSEMLRTPMSELQKPLRVTFIGEDGCDQGALSVDFFRLVFDELLNPDKHDLCRYLIEHDSSISRVWFRKESACSLAEMCGLLFGLSLYNKALVPLPFPQLLYAKLLGKGPSSGMEEIAILDKDIGDQMSKLLNGSEDYVMGCCYGAEVEMEDGRIAEVTTENVHLYVEKRNQDLLAPSQFAAFKQGFHKVYNPAILEMFRPVELEALVNGDDYFDWIALQQATRYTGPYSESHSTIIMFWQVFQDLEDDMKRKFLVFVSGSDRVPVGGLGNLGLTIAPLKVPFDESIEDDYEERVARLLPVGHACDNNFFRRTLQLPRYTSVEIVKDLLNVALSYYDSPFLIA